MSNIDCAHIDIDSLPSIPLSNKSELPDVAGIYFAIDSIGTIQYIGRSVNIRKRWINHHRKPELVNLGVKIAWMVIEPVSLLPEVENALIFWFKPALNGTKLNSPQISTKVEHIDLSHINQIIIKQSKKLEYGEKKVQMAFGITPTAQAGLQEIALSMNIARSELIERIGRGLLVVSEPSEKLV